MIKYLENDDFKKEIEKDFIIVDFFAEWCGPCKMMSLELEKINEEVLKVNTDTYPDIAKEYGVMSIPTLVFMKNGVEVKRSVGFIRSDEIMDIVKEIK